MAASYNWPMQQGRWLLKLKAAIVSLVALVLLETYDSGLVWLSKVASKVWIYHSCVINPKCLWCGVMWIYCSIDCC